MNLSVPRAAAMAITALLACGGRAQAQALTWDNVHINVTDPARAAEWYVKHLGATLVGAPGRATQAMFGNVVLVFLKGQEPQTSAGSLIDHIGFSVSDVDARMKEIEAGGGKVLTPPRDMPGLFKAGFVEDPFGVKIEIVQDPERLGLHHVHLSVPNQEATLKWYHDMFGGEQARLKGRIDGLRYGGVWLLAENGKTTNPKGAIQYIGLRVADVRESAAALRMKGVTFTTEPRALGNLWYAIAEDRDGSRVEMIQRAQP
jgi:catechol 2,3-dioxygenase-like lactoylglutathione lyase family enzyme